MVKRGNEGYRAVGQGVAENAVVLHGLVIVLEPHAIEEEFLTGDRGFVGSEPCVDALEEEEDGLAWFVTDVDGVVWVTVGDDDIECRSHFYRVKMWRSKELLCKERRKM